MELWNASSPVDDTLTGSFFSSGISVASSLAFARNGRALAVGNADGSLQEWDVANAKDPHLLTTFVSGDGVAISPVGSVAVSPDGQWVAAGRDNGTVSVWNLDAASAAPEWTLTTDTTRVNTLAFGQGSVLATGSDDETVQLWNLDVDHAISRVCSLAGGDLTPALWATYIPQVPYKSPCP